MPPKTKETQETSSSASKRHSRQQEEEEEEEEDIISSLPDHMLLEILSFLDMKHAVQTTILSKRWRDLWASLRRLQFDTQLFYSSTKDRVAGFKKFVNQVLLLRHNSDIERFSIFSQGYQILSRLNTWIISVIISNVQELELEVWNDGPIRLPNCLFTSNSLTTLILSFGYDDRWTIVLPDSMCLPNLQVLHIYYVLFDDDENLTNNFFSCCPNLKQLTMIDVEFLRMDVNLSCPKLRVLTVDNHEHVYSGYSRWPDSTFKLNALGLSSFSCKDYMFKDYILENLPSLFTVDIDMRVEEVEDHQNPGLYSKLPVEKKQMYARRMMQCLRALVHVKDLKLSAWFLEAISGSPDLLVDEPTELRGLTCLRLETWLSVDTIRAIAYLLKISPNIKSFFLEINQFVSGNVRDCPEAEVPLQCLLDKLENIEMKGAVGCANELSLLEVFLKNAKVLKELVVYTSKEDSLDRKKQLMEFTEKLLLLPRRASSNIKILFL